MLSSYAQHNYGAVFKAIVSAFQPTTCVELGCLEGYSTVAIAQGLKENGQGHLTAVDLFESYEFRNSPQARTQANIDAAGVSEFVTLRQGDAFTAHELFADNSVALLHVDLSNTGETVKHIMDHWDAKMVQGGLILFEGGTEERDSIEWMTKFSKAPIKQELENNATITEKYVMATYMRFPGLSCLLKKR